MSAARRLCVVGLLLICVVTTQQLNQTESAVPLSMTQCLPTLENGCSCFNKPVEVRCFAVQLNNIPEGLPVNVRILDVQDNRIDYLLYIPYFQLERLVLSGNFIRFIGNDCFKDLNNLHLLRLPNNIISSIEGRTFHGLSSLRHLDLDNNRLYEISKSTFSGSELPNLTNLYLSKCRIYKFDEGAIEGVHSLHFLNLSRNYLKELQPLDDGIGFPNLTTLDLSYNELILDYNLSLFKWMARLNTLFLQGNAIEVLGNHTFQGLKDSLMNLYLQHNNIKFIYKDTFDEFKALKILDISHNLVIIFEPETSLGHLDQLLVSENPWECSCNNRWLRDFEAVTKWNEKSAVRCLEPLDYANVSVFEVPVSVFQTCSSRQTERSDSFVAVLVVTAVVVLLGGLALLIFCKRKNRCRRSSSDGTSSSYHRMADMTGSAFSVSDREDNAILS